MNTLRNLFFDQNLTWPKLIGFSIICGVVTGGITLIPALDSTSVHNIAVCFEAWILLAMFIILNSKSPLEAGLKTFVFFLISQPLCYLVQVPFVMDGFGIFRYYPYWAVLTVLTLPGGMTAWFVKKQNWLSVVLMSVILLVLSIELTGHFVTMTKFFPSQLLAVLFIPAEMALLIAVVFTDKTKRIVMFVICLALIGGCALNHYLNPPKISVSCQLPDNGPYSIVKADESITAEIKDGCFLSVTGSQNGRYAIQVQGPDGTVQEYIFTISNEGSNLQPAERDQQ